MTVTKTAIGTSTDSAKPPATFTWLQVSVLRNIVFHAMCVLSGGLLIIFCINFPHCRMDMVTIVCKSALEAEFVLVAEGEEKRYIEVEHHSIDAVDLTCFEDCGVRYVAAREKQWVVEELPSEPVEFSELFVSTKNHKNRPTRAYLQAVYGLNQMKIEAADAFTVTLREVVSPFYLFQYFAVAVWLYTDYIIYSVVVIWITIMSIVFCVRSKLYNLKRLHDLAGSQRMISMYDIVTDSVVAQEVSDQSLVPGDCFVVTPGTSSTALLSLGCFQVIYVSLAALWYLSSFPVYLCTFAFCLCLCLCL
jgi:hypothetical protein